MTFANIHQDLLTYDSRSVSF